MGPNCMHSRSNRGLALPTSSLFLSESVAGSARTCASRSSARQTLSPFLGFGRRRRRLRRRATVKSFRCSPLPLLLHSPPARRTDGRSIIARTVFRVGDGVSRVDRGRARSCLCQFWMAESTQAQAGQRRARFLRQRSLKRSATAATAVLASRSPLISDAILPDTRMNNRGKGDGWSWRERKRKSIDVQDGKLHKYMISCGAGRSRWRRSRSLTIMVSSVCAPPSIQQRNQSWILSLSRVVHSSSDRSFVHCLICKMCFGARVHPERASNQSLLLGESSRSPKAKTRRTDADAATWILYAY